MLPKSITTDITIYNKVIEDKKIKWKYTQLTGVFLTKQRQIM